MLAIKVVQSIEVPDLQYCIKLDNCRVFALDGSTETSAFTAWETGTFTSKAKIVIDGIQVNNNIRGLTSTGTDLPVT